MEIKFHKNLYTYKAIKESIDKFKELSSLTLSRRGNYYIVDFKSKKGKINFILIDEFTNFVLYLSILEQKGKKLSS